MASIGNNIQLDYQKTVFDTAKSYGKLSDDQAKIIVAQAMHESDNFTSPLFKATFNCVGMKMPKVRPHPHILKPSDRVMKKEGSTPYAAYSSVENCIKDLIDWHTYNKTDWSKIITPEYYANYMKKRGYYGDPESVYSKALATFYNSANWIKNNPGSASAVIVVFLIISFILINLK